MGMQINRWLLTAVASVSLFSCSSSDDEIWVATWATAEQIAEPHNLPPVPLAGNSIRQIVQTSISGETVRLRFSNEFGEAPVEIEGGEIALALSSGGSSDVNGDSVRQLSFCGQPSVVIYPGEYVVCDPLKFQMGARENVAVTLHFGSVPADIITSHPGSRTSSYIAEGYTSDFTGAAVTAHWYIINDIEVLAPRNGGAVVVLGDSITDGRGTTTDGQNRWTDILSRRLLADETTAHLSVLNMGLGGNCVLEKGLGLPAVQRYERDLFGQQGVKYVILFEGVNDLGNAGDSCAVSCAERIISFYTAVADEAHSKGIKVFVATVMPFKGHYYFTEDHEVGRQMLNAWIRSYEGFDGVIDFAAVMGSEDDPDRLNPAYLYENDWLHPNADGYLRMGEAVDLSLFK